jgi:hypothetical protein
MSDDIVAELDRWLDETSREHPEVARCGYVALWTIDREAVRRARDEIVALRDDRNAHAAREAGVLARIAWVEALEEAARVADGYCTERTDSVAAAIRALKEKR